MEKQELLDKIKSLNKQIPKSSAKMLLRMDATKARVESKRTSISKRLDAIIIQSGI